MNNLPPVHAPDNPSLLAFGDLAGGGKWDYNRGMWMAMLFSPTRRTFITACHMGHERSITVDQNTPMQDWTLTCPLCGDEHQLSAPQILSSDL